MKRFTTYNLETIASISSGSTPLRARYEEFFRNGHIPWVKTTDLNNGYITNTEEHITDLASKKCKIFPKGTILVAMYGGFNQIGRTGLLAQPCAINQALSALQLDPKIAIPEYVLQNLNYNVKKWRRFAASSRKDPNITSNDVKDFTIDLPPLPEQRAIADILSTWDSAIDTTEKLIAAKEERFRWDLKSLILDPSLNGQWDLKILGELFSPITRKNTLGENNVLTSSAQHGLVSQLKYYKKSVSAEDLSGYYLLKNGEFAYNRSSSKGYPYGTIKRLESEEQGVLSTLYICMKINDQKRVNSDFFSHLFESGILNRELSLVCQEGARSHGLLNIAKADFFNLRVPLPPKEAQEDISKILNLKAEEIKLLKSISNYYKQQKRGLMQKLLTGEWRVKGV